MRGSDSTTVDALVAARAAGLVPRQLVTITARALDDGEPTEFSFWNGLLPVDIEVLGGASGELVTRGFAADNALLEVSRIRLSSELSIRPATVRLNPAHPTVLAMLAGYDLRLAPIEIHRGLLDVTTRLPVAAPRCRFLGVIETVQRTRPAAGGEGTLTLACISQTVELTRTNPARRSDETQRLRSGDRMMRYAETVGEWEIYWGEAEGKAK